MHDLLLLHHAVALAAAAAASVSVWTPDGAIDPLAGAGLGPEHDGSSFQRAHCMCPAQPAELLPPLVPPAPRRARGWPC